MAAPVEYGKSTLPSRPCRFPCPRGQIASAATATRSSCCRVARTNAFL